MKAACEGWKPPTTEMGIIAATNVYPAWDGSNLGSGNSGSVAIWYNAYCDVISVKDWKPQNPGFEVRFSAYL